MYLEKWVGSNCAGFCLESWDFWTSLFTPVDSCTQRLATVCGEMAAGCPGFSCLPGDSGTLPPHICRTGAQPAAAPSILWKPSLASIGAGWIWQPVQGWGQLLGVHSAPLHTEAWRALGTWLVRKSLIKGSTLMECGQQATLCTLFTHFRRNRKLELTGKAKAGLRSLKPSQPAPCCCLFPCSRNSLPSSFCLLLGFIVTSGD